MQHEAHIPGDEAPDSEVAYSAPLPPAPSRIANFIAALRFLFPLQSPRPGALDDTRTDIVAYIVPIGLVIGLIWAGAFRLSWWLFGETSNLRIVPALTVILIECLFTGPFLVLGLARTVHILTTAEPRGLEPDPRAALSPVGSLVLCLVILSQFILILSIQQREGWWPAPDDWRSHFNFMYPRPIFRPLLLAPLWGRWGILLAASIGRTARHADPQTHALNRRLTTGRMLQHALLPLVLTAIYCSRSRNFLTGLLIALLVFTLTYLVAVAMAHRARGQSRLTLFAAGQIAQLAFLTIYRACWRLIDA